MPAEWRSLGARLRAPCAESPLVPGRLSTTQHRRDSNSRSSWGLPDFKSADLHGCASQMHISDCFILILKALQRPPFQGIRPSSANRLAPKVRAGQKNRCTMHPGRRISPWSGARQSLVEHPSGSQKFRHQRTARAIFWLNSLVRECHPKPARTNRPTWV
jgi:hypothetical protein